MRRKTTNRLSLSAGSTKRSFSGKSNHHFLPMITNSYFQEIQILSTQRFITSANLNKAQLFPLTVIIHPTVIPCITHSLQCSYAKRDGCFVWPLYIVITPVCKQLTFLKLSWMFTST